MEHTIVYIHGAFASQRSFVRIKDKLPAHTQITPEYSVETELSQIIENIDAMITQYGKPVSIVGHSLGGVIAVAIANNNPLVQKIITMGTPFGGCKAADLFKWFNPHVMFDGISTKSTIIRKNLASKLKCPVRSLVTTHGNNPMFFEPNDGVVSVASQISLKGPEYIQVPFSHSEVLMTDDAVNYIKEFIFV